MNFVYFDLETQRSANEVGGWDHADKMGLSLAVTYSTKRGTFEIYQESEVEALVTELQRAECVVGFNVVEFDYKVLSPYFLFDFSQVPTLDLLLDIKKVIGTRVRLDDVAEASVGAGKTSSGDQALKWWKQGKMLEIAEYCCYDVKATRAVHEFGIRNGHVLITDKATRLKKKIEVMWKTSYTISQ